DSEEGQIASLSVLLWLTLVHGNCDCHQYTENLCLQVDPNGLHPPTEHNLVYWNGKESLRKFLFKEIVSGRLRRPHDGQGEVAQVNGFRRGMLAKVIVGPGLLS